MSKIIWTKPHISNNCKNSFYVNRCTWPSENRCSGQVRLWQRPSWRLTAVWSFSWVLFPCLIGFVSTRACPGALSLIWCRAPPSYLVFSLSLSLPPSPSFCLSAHTWVLLPAKLISSLPFCLTHCPPLLEDQVRTSATHWHPPHIRCLC